MENVEDYLDTSTGGEVDRYINESIQDLYDIITEAMGQEYFLKSDTITTVAGVADYTISVADDDFYMLRGVDWESGDTKVPLRPYNFIERHDDDIRWSTLRDPWGGVPLRYRLYGAVDNTSPTTTGYDHKIRFTPEPQSAETIRLWYIPHPPALDSDADVFDGFNGWEEYVIIDAAIKCLEKEDNDTSKLNQRKALLIQRIQALAPNRDMGANEYIADVESYE